MSKIPQQHGMGKGGGVYIIVGSNNEEKISEKVSYLLDNSQIAELL